MVRPKIRGQIVTDKQFCNNIYPKFTVEDYYSSTPLQEVIESPDQLDAIPPGTDIYEPTELGLGTRSRTMYVVVKDTTYLFDYNIEHITWGSWVVTFLDYVTMGGDIL